MITKLVSARMTYKITPSIFEKSRSYYKHKHHGYTTSFRPIFVCFSISKSEQTLKI
jgi:hypothetical protein